MESLSKKSEKNLFRPSKECIQSLLNIHLLLVLVSQLRDEYYRVQKRIRREYVLFIAAYFSVKSSLSQSTILHSKAFVGLSVLECR